MNLPDDVPTVTFESTLGEYVEDIDFDYGTFNEMARTRGMTDEEINSYSVHFTTQKLYTGLLGRYAMWKRRSKINVPASMDDYLESIGPEIVQTPGERVDSVARHETGHWVDHVRRTGGCISAIRARWIAFQGLCLTAVSSIELARTTDYWEITATPWLALMGSLAVTDRLLNSYLKENENVSLAERPAVDFEKETRGYRIVTVTPILQQSDI